MNLNLQSLQDLITQYGPDMTLQSLMNLTPGSGTVTHLDMVLDNPRDGDRIQTSGERVWEYELDQWNLINNDGPVPLLPQTAYRMSMRHRNNENITLVLMTQPTLPRE